jgi:hypothetical protein
MQKRRWVWCDADRLRFRRRPAAMAMLFVGVLGLVVVRCGGDIGVSFPRTAPD